uniref:Uncharacterized protein n=1 Tax=Oryza punctata TaxID=4537 RepID=A0A0E0LTQ6_ORYPU
MASSILLAALAAAAVFFFGGATPAPASASSPAPAPAPASSPAPGHGGGASGPAAPGHGGGPARAPALATGTAASSPAARHYGGTAGAIAPATDHAPAPSTHPCHGDGGLSPDEAAILAVVIMALNIDRILPAPNYKTHYNQNQPHGIRQSETASRTTLTKERTSQDKIKFVLQAQIYNEQSSPQLPPDTNIAFVRIPSLEQSSQSLPEIGLDSPITVQSRPPNPYANTEGKQYSMSRVMDSLHASGSCSGSRHNLYRPKRIVHPSKYKS